MGAMTAHTAKRAAAAVLIGLALVASACGDTADNAKRKPKAAPASSADLTNLLMRAGEEPGFRPGALRDAMPRSRATITGVNAFVKEMRLTPTDARRLRSEGFISFTAGPIRGPRTAGITNVALYETADGAKRSMAHDLRPDVIRAFGPVENLRFFTVPGVPGARGWTASTPRVGNVSWVQGGCWLTLGNQGPGPFVGPLSSGARAIYRRTKGQCPAPASTDAAVRVLWPAPKDPLERTAAAGLEPERKEFLTHHVHAHLDAFVDGKPIAVPAGIGINIADREVRRFDEPDGSVSYGGIRRCQEPCISPLHTHDASGIIHTESATAEPNTLGQFFTEWGVRLTESCVAEHCAPEHIAFYVNGVPYTKDPSAIALTDRKEIAIVIGTPPPKIPKTADFSNA